GRTATGGRTTFRLLGGMIVAEVALAIALVTGAGWLIQSFARLRTTDPGFVARGRLVFDVRPSFRRFPTPADVVPWSNDMLERLRRIASVVHAGSSTTFPLRAERDSIQFIHIEGEPVDPNRAAGGRYRRVSQGFFAAMGIGIISGRDFTGDDRQDTTPVAIVNQAFVRRYLRTRNPPGARFAFGYPTVDLKTMRAIVGVVDDVKYKSLSDAVEPAYY